VAASAEGWEAGDVAAMEAAAGWAVAAAEVGSVEDLAA
jgi:hypothetical protein